MKKGMGLKYGNFTEMTVKLYLVSEGDHESIIVRRVFSRSFPAYNEYWEIENYSMADSYDRVHLQYFDYEKGWTTEK